MGAGDSGTKSNTEDTRILRLRDETAAREVRFTHSTAAKNLPVTLELLSHVGRRANLAQATLQLKQHNELDNVRSRLSAWRYRFAQRFVYVKYKTPTCLSVRAIFGLLYESHHRLDPANHPRGLLA